MRIYVNTPTNREVDSLDSKYWERVSKWTIIIDRDQCIFGVDTIDESESPSKILFTENTLAEVT